MPKRHGTIGLESPMKDLDLTTLRYFVAVCETGNIARAAQEHHVVASAISKRLGQMEGDLRVSLLERGRRGVVPTAAGETMLEHARSILASASRIAQDMAGYGSGMLGKVHLMATVSSLAESLPEDVAAFMNLPEHRQIQVEVEEALSDAVVRRVREGSASLGVLWDATELHGLNSVPYRTDQLAAVVHTSHPLARRKRCTFAETLAYEHVGLAASTAVNRMLTRSAAKVGREIVYRAQVSNFEAAMRVVRANLGISIIPKEVAQFHAEALSVAIVPLQDAWAKRRFTICFRGKEHLSKASLMLLDFLAARST